MTRRNLIIQLLQSSCREMTAREISIDLGIQESTVTRDLEHVAKSLRARGQVLLVRPATCVECGFKFRHSKARWPGKCPSCRSTRISPPGFKIVSPQGRRQLEKPSQTVE